MKQYNKIFIKMLKEFILILSIIKLINSCSICLAACGVFGVSSIVAVNPAMMAIDAKCYQACIGICATGPFQCFSNDTEIKVIENGKTINKKIENVEENDIVLTYDLNKKEILTFVIRNEKSEGNFDFVLIEAGNKKLKVTKDHIMIILENNLLKIKKAEELKINDEILTEEGILKIKNISNFQLDTKYTLITEAGTVLANGIFVSIACDNDLKELKSNELKELLSNWKK